MAGLEGAGKAFVIGRVTEDALEGSYVRAFQKLGFTVTHWNMPAAIDRNARGGRIGRYLNQFWPVETWSSKASRDLLIDVMESQPDLLIVTGTNRVTFGALSQIRAALPHCKLVLIWPDTLLNCYAHSLNCVPLYDLVAAYSRESAPVFTLMGARQVEWVPLAFDPDLHPPELQPDRNAATYADCDASFVGNHSPERERLVLHLISRGFRIKVWGPSTWRRHARDSKSVTQYWQGKALFGKDYCLAVKSSPVSLNPVSLLNFPAANMRFFEILGVGGTPLSANCPEMSAEFPDGEACFYYGAGQKVADVLDGLRQNPQHRERVAREGQKRILAGHTYVHRARQILSALSKPSHSCRQI